VPVEATVTAPPFTARLPESVLVPIESAPAFVTAPSVLPNVKVAEAPEAMLSAFVPERAVPKVSEPPLPTDTEPVKALSVPLTERMPLVESVPVPLNSPLNEPPETISEPELLTDPLVRVETWTNALEPTVNLPAVNEPMVLKPLPLTPRVPPLVIPPTRVAVPSTTTVPVRAWPKVKLDLKFDTPVPSKVSIFTVVPTPVKLRVPLFDTVPKEPAVKEYKVLLKVAEPPVEMDNPLPP